MKKRNLEKEERFKKRIFIAVIAFTLLTGGTACGNRGEQTEEQQAAAERMEELSSAEEESLMGAENGIFQNAGLKV